MSARIFILLIACVTAGCANANSATASTQQEINRSVWQPFKTAFEAMDGEALNALYAKDVLRVTPGGLDTEEKFKGFNLRRFEENIARSDHIALDFWFDSRQSNAHTAYEVGFFRFTITSRTGQTSRFYGQFHIVLQKIEGSWKITQDWDTDQIASQPINETVFARGTPAAFD